VEGVCVLHGHSRQALQRNMSWAKLSSALVRRVCRCDASENCSHMLYVHAMHDDGMWPRYEPEMSFPHIAILIERTPLGNEHLKACTLLKAISWSNASAHSYVCLQPQDLTQHARHLSLHVRVRQ
jgi:hypothetical protein